MVPVNCIFLIQFKNHSTEKLLNVQRNEFFFFSELNFSYNKFLFIKKKRLVKFVFLIFIPIDMFRIT